MPQLSRSKCGWPAPEVFCGIELGIAAHSCYKAYFYPYYDQTTLSGQIW